MAVTAPAGAAAGDVGYPPGPAEGATGGTAAGGARAQAGTAVTAARHSFPAGPRDRGPVLWILVFCAGVYGGYFGAAQGILLMGLFGIVFTDTRSGSTRSRTCSPALSTRSRRWCSSRHPLDWKSPA